MKGRRVSDSRIFDISDDHDGANVMNDDIWLSWVVDHRPCELASVTDCVLKLYRVIQTKLRVTPCQRRL